MIEDYKGHTYRLSNLKSKGFQTLQFYQDAERHPAKDGTSCQEVIRALIARVSFLEEERHWFGNQLIIGFLRKALCLFEMRALQRKVEKGAQIELWPTYEDGHIYPWEALTRGET